MKKLYDAALDERRTLLHSTTSMIDEGSACVTTVSEISRTIHASTRMSHES